MSAPAHIAAVSGLSADQVRRYSRQILLPEIGLEGQRRLSHASVLLVGVGGLGSPAALYLTAAGVGRLVLVDDDRVDVSNLQRQILYSTSDVGRSKLEAAAARLRALNPSVHVETREEPFAASSGLRLVQGMDVVVDGTDNFPARYLVNDACVLAQVPNVFGSIKGFEGQASVFAMGGGPCYRCLHPEPPPDGAIPSCAEAGVLGVLPGFIGSVQATEAIKLVTRIGSPLVGRFLLYDALRMRVREIALPRDPECVICGDRPSINGLVRYDEPGCATSVDTPTLDGQSAQISVDELHRWRATARRHVLIDVRELDEHALSSIPGARLIPLQTLERHVSSLPTDCPVVVHCRSGARSSRAAERLRARGFDARSLKGGIDAWRRRALE